MPAIHIRNVPEETVAALKRRAAANERSLEQELRHALKSLAAEAPPAGPLPPVKLRLSKAVSASSWRREDIYGDSGR